MAYDYYLLAPECIQKEIKEVISGEIHLKGIKASYFSPSKDLRDSEIILNMIRELKCDNDILLLCDISCSEIPVPEEYSACVKINSLEHICALFADRKILQAHENEGAFIIVPGWLEKWQYNLNFLNIHKQYSGKPFSELYSSILILDTGIHPGFLVTAEDMSRFTCVPFKVLDVGMEHFKLAFENLVFRWNIEKKQNQLNVCNRKVASYAMSIDFIKSMADFTEESDAVESICNFFSTMFAPKNVVYYSFNGDEAELRYYKSSDTDQKAVLKLKDSDANYFMFDSGDGFAIKVTTKEDLLGIIELHNVAFPGNLDEYLSVGCDLAKAAGLAISNIRRYHEIFRSREEQVKLTDMLRTTNRILRHDIANDLQIITVALSLFEGKGDKKYLFMIRKAAMKSASLIQGMKELDNFSVGDGQLELLNVKDLIDQITNNYAVEFNVTGNCFVRGDKALSSVFDNIISNAIIHGNTGRIDIEILSRNDKCEISIADNGTGIPDEVKSRVFDEGYTYGKTAHTGFGLYIAKKTVERLKGSIRVEDNVPSGAKFIIELVAAQVGNHDAN